MGCCGGTTKKVRQIVAGYINLVRGVKYEFTDDRVRVCQKCDYNYWLGRVLFCGECKCPIPAKARVKENTCPKNLWPS